MLPALRKCSTMNASVKATAKTTGKDLIRGDILDGWGGLGTFPTLISQSACDQAAFEGDREIFKASIR